jgi:YbgC/YbaW family acyl-CoA thioester hydrolase
MAATYTRRFQVRFSECDAYGNMYSSSYFRRMQETAFEASADLGYDFEKYNQLGTIWLIRETKIDHYEPLWYGDQIDVKTWVLDFRRFRSIRMYEFRIVETGQLAARASTDWISRDSENLRPVSIPAEMQLAFLPEAAQLGSQPRQRFTVASDIPNQAVVLHRKVSWGDIDMMWHMNNAVYLDYLAEAEEALLAETGWSRLSLRTNGIKLAAKHQHIEYRQPAMLADELEISAWFAQVTGSTLLVSYLINRLKDGQLLAQAQSSWEGIDLESGRQVRFTGKLLSDLRSRASGSLS